MTEELTLHSLTNDRLKAVLKRALPSSEAFNGRGSSRWTPGLLVSPSAYQARQTYVKELYKLGLPSLKRAYRGGLAAWRACLGDLTLASDLRDRPIWGPDADAERLHSAALGVPPLPVFRVCKKWRRMLLQECIGEVVVCGTGEAVPASTQVLVTLGRWPDEDARGDKLDQLGHLDQLPALQALVLVHVPDPDLDLDAPGRNTYVRNQYTMLPPIPARMRHLQHLMYVNLDQRTREYPAHSWLPDGTIESVHALTRLQTLHLPSVSFGDDVELCADATQQLLAGLTGSSLRALYLGQSFVCDLARCTALTGLTALHVSAPHEFDPATEGMRSYEPRWSGKIDVAPLTHLRSLDTLCLSSCRVAERAGAPCYPCDITAADKLTQLRHLELRWFEPGADTVRALAALSDLRYLRISTGSRDFHDPNDAEHDEGTVQALSDAASAAGAAHPFSLSLRVTMRSDVDPGLGPLSALTSLRSLNVLVVRSDYGAMEPPELQALSALTALTSLAVADGTFGLDGCLALACLVGLVKLRLRTCYLTLPDVVQTLTALRELRLQQHIRGGGPPDAVLEAMRIAQSCLGLTTLQLPFHVSPSQQRVAELARLSALQQLDLSGTGVTDEGVAELRVSQTLCSLHLSHCRRLSAAALQHLASCRSLRCVNVKGSHINENAREARALTSQGVMVDCWVPDCVGYLDPYFAAVSYSAFAYSHV